MSEVRSTEADFGKLTIHFRRTSDRSEFEIA